MEIEYDPTKEKRNLRKHRIGFEEAASCFQDDQALAMEDPFSENELRWALIGLSRRFRLLTVVYTLRNGRIRIISARKATKSEMEDYAQRV